MTNIASNPSVCCPTCAEFPGCLTCEGSALMKLSVTFSDVPDASVSCDCLSPPFPPGRWGFDKNLLWSNLNGTYELEQTSPGSDCFAVTFVNDCEYVQDSDAVIVEDGAFGCCHGGTGRTEHIIYLTGIAVCIGCVDNEMQIATVTLGGFCRCSRSCDPMATPECGDWYCSEEYPYPFECGLGDYLQGATPCTAQAMERELLWPDLQVLSNPCGIEMSCNDPVVGTIKATLGC